MAVFLVEIEAQVPAQTAKECIRLCEDEGFAVVKGAAILGTEPKHLEMSVQSDVRYLPYDSECRLLAQNVSANLILSDGTVHATRIKLCNGERINLQIKTDAENVELEGEVKNCIPLTCSGLHFRVGIDLKLDERMTLIKWVQIVRSIQSM